MAYKSNDEPLVPKGSDLAAKLNEGIKELATSLGIGLYEWGAGNYLAPTVFDINLNGTMVRPFMLVFEDTMQQKSANN